MWVCVYMGFIVKSQVYFIVFMLAPIVVTCWLKVSKYSRFSMVRVSEGF